jgi:hypothetical protein
MTKNLHTHSIVARLALLTAAPRRRADHRCDDIANQLKTHIDGLKVGMTAANTIYLSHPLAIELSLGCSGRNFKNELYAKADSRKPKPAFLDLVGSAAAIIFTLPKDNTLTGVTRCIERMGLLRGESRCAIAASTSNAPAPGPRRRLRSRAARMSEEARAISDIRHLTGARLAATLAIRRRVHVPS